MRTIVEFDHEKATQALNYLTVKEGGSISKLKAIKLIWLVDRYHLRKYGRPITNDTYYAMKLGPVGSSAKDVAECSEFLSEEERSYLDAFLSCNRKDNTIMSKRGVDFDVFSESEIEALDAIYKTFGHHKQSVLVDFTHDYPEWSKFKHQLESGGASRVVMSYSDFFSDPPNKKGDFFKSTPEKINASKQTFEENFHVANFWA